jgi:hypothetical protein
VINNPDLASQASGRENFENKKLTKVNSLFSSKGINNPNKGQNDLKNGKTDSNKGQNDPNKVISNRDNVDNLINKGRPSSKTIESLINKIDKITPDGHKYISQFIGNSNPTNVEDNRINVLDNTTKNRHDSESAREE